MKGIVADIGAPNRIAVGNIESGGGDRAIRIATASHVLEFIVFNNEISSATRSQRHASDTVEHVASHD